MIFPFAYASGTTLNGLRLTFGSVASHPPQPPSPCEVTAAKIFYRTLNMKIERFAGHHHEARDALVLSVAGVTTIMLIANLLLVIWH